MSSYPPPGPYGGQPVPAPSWPPAGYPPYAGPGAPPGPGPLAGPPVHQPGVVPLRPLTLGDFFGGATAVIRRNPTATVGMAAVVTLAFMLIPIAGTLLLGATGRLPSMDVLDGSSDPTSGLGLNAASLVSAVFDALAGIVVTGLLVRVVEHALLGGRMSGGEAWVKARGRLLPLLGLSLLISVIAVLVVGVPVGVGVGIGLLLDSFGVSVALGLLAGVAAVVAVIFLYVRFGLLAAPSLVVEGHGVLRSLTRAGELSRGQFWRLLGINLLAALAAGMVGQVLSIPVTILGFIGLFLLPGSWGMAGLMLASYLATVLVGAVTRPFTSGVVALQYFDQRFRKEGHDIELLNRALGRAPDGAPAR